MVGARGDQPEIVEVSYDQRTTRLRRILTAVNSPDHRFLLSRFITTDFGNSYDISFHWKCHVYEKLQYLHLAC